MLSHTRGVALGKEVEVLSCQQHNCKSIDGMAQKKGEGTNSCLHLLLPPPCNTHTQTHTYMHMCTHLVLQTSHEQGHALIPWSPQGPIVITPPRVHLALTGHHCIVQTPTSNCAHFLVAKGINNTRERYIQVLVVFDAVSQLPTIAIAKREDLAICSQVPIFQLRCIIDVVLEVEEGEEMSLQETANTTSQTLLT